MCETSKEEPSEIPKKPEVPSRSYYYDDAHGYQDFDPEGEESNDEDEEELP
jgi:hypothetical protein